MDDRSTPALRDRIEIESFGHGRGVKVTLELHYSDQLPIGDIRALRDAVQAALDRRRPQTATEVMQQQEDAKRRRFFDWDYAESFAGIGHEPRYIPCRSRPYDDGTLTAQDMRHGPSPLPLPAGPRPSPAPAPVPAPARIPSMADIMATNEAAARDSVQQSMDRLARMFAPPKAAPPADAEAERLARMFDRAWK